MKTLTNIPVAVHRGAFQNDAANAFVSAIAPEFESSDNQQDSNFGVDSHEITEYHLQAALSSTQVDNIGNAPTKKYHIPTPQSVEVLSQAQYHEQYPTNVYFDPVTYVRFSDTVEACNRGSPYCMDEDDKGWLDKHNEKVQSNLEKALKDSKAEPTEAEAARVEALVRKEAPEYCSISEDEFETIMYVFERTTCERHPLLELDMSKLPPLSELLPQFEPNSSCSALALPELPALPNDLSSCVPAPAEKNNSSKNTPKPGSGEPVWSAKNPFRYLHLLKPGAHAVYPWWKLRRQAREGRPIVPSLNFDESNENDPYVCFRRREVKSARKTRKTDTLQLEKLVRLEVEMRQAASLFFMIAQRERLKELSVKQAKACWNTAQELLAFKRSWDITGPSKGKEDESLLFGIQPDPLEPVPSTTASQHTQLLKKKRKADEAASSTSSTVLKLRRPKTEPEYTHSTTKAGIENVNSSTGVSSIMDRMLAVQQYIDHECTLRQQADAGMEDLTDSAFQPSVAPPPIRAFRPIQSDNNDTHFWSNHPFARPGRQSCFRRRVGRGGRVFLDRRPIAVSPAPANIGAWPRQRQNGFPLATFGFDRSSDSMKRMDGFNRIHAGFDTFRSYAPVVQSSRVAPMLLPTPDLSWDPLNSKDPREPLTHDPDLKFRRVNKTGVYHVEPQNTESASTASDSTDRTQSSDEMGDGQSTQATDIDQEESKPMDEDKSPELKSQSTLATREEAVESVEEQMERAQKLAERWRYDEDGGRYAGLGLLGLGGMEGDEEAVLDDFDQRFIRFRMSLLDEANLLKLSTDWTHMRQALIAASSNLHTRPSFSVADAQKNAAGGATSVTVANETSNTKPVVSSTTKDGSNSSKPSNEK